MKTIKVSGSVSDFNGVPLAGADVYFNDEQFEHLYEFKTDSQGIFEAETEDRIYPSVFICKDYKETNLEYWHWNYSPQENDFLQTKIDGLELYGLKAWEARPTYPGMMLFFRPMSLKRYKALGEADKDQPMLIAPDLDREDIEVFIDSKSCKILGVNKVKEYVTEKQYLDAYLIHISLEDVLENPKRLIISIKDRQTLEKGMAGVDLR